MGEGGNELAIDVKPLRCTPMQATDTIACRGIDFCNFIRLCIWSDILQCPNSEAHGILQLSMLTKSSYPECSRRNYDWSNKFEVCIRQDIAGELMVAQLELKLLRFRHGFALALVSWYSHDTSQNLPYWRKIAFEEESTINGLAARNLILNKSDF